MKDTPVKTIPTPPLPLKSKLVPKKNKMAAKKMKEHKTPIMKVGKGKKVSGINKAKSKLLPEPKRRRGRPRNEAKPVHAKKPGKEPKAAKKNEDLKANGGRKRKLNNVDSKHVPAALKKPKMNDGNCNGDIKMPIHSIGKTFVQKGDSPVLVDHTASSVIHSNGTLHGKKTLMFDHKKAPLSMLKSATFHPPSPLPKKELLNGNNSPPSFKFQPIRNKTSLKKDLEVNSSPKETELSSKFEKSNSIAFPCREPMDTNCNDLPKGHPKEVKFCSKEPLKSQPFKVLSKECAKYLGKDLLKSQIKEPPKVLPQSKEPLKSQTKDQIKPQQKESCKNSKEPTKPVPSKSQSKEPAKSQTKELAKPKAEPVKPLFREPIKTHPQRMASLDAMAKMHVICISDRKPPEPKHTSVAVCPSRPFSHQKSVTQCHERIQVDVKKETNEFKGNIVHKQEIKQQVFVSHSVEQSSIVEREQSKTISTKVQNEKETKKAKPSEKQSATTNNNKKPAKSKAKQSPSNNLKTAERTPKVEKNKSKIVAKGKDGDKKVAKVQSKTASKVTKGAKEKPDVKSTCKKTTKKVEQQTKSEVKVKETIRMQKTCTYQSVTTVNSHGTANSSVVPVSHVGMTTNISKTKKTVVTDEECKNKVNYSAGSVINNSYCLTTESPCSIGPHTDCCKFHAHPQIIPVAHMQACSLGHNVNRAADTSNSSSHCDGSFSMHRFGHQQPVIFANPTPDLGCCCANSVVHDSCLLRKSIVAYPHHLPSHHHSHLSAAFPPPECSDCGSTAHHHSSHHHHHHRQQHPVKHQQQQHYAIASSSSAAVAASRPYSSCCYCESNHQQQQQQRHHSLHYAPQQPSPPKTTSSSSLVPCEQSPLDLSLASSSSSSGHVSEDSVLPLPPPQGHFAAAASPLCCGGDLLLLRTTTTTPPRPFQQQHCGGNGFKNSCCCISSKQAACESSSSSQADTVQSCSSSKSAVVVSSPPPQQGSLLPPPAVVAPGGVDGCSSLVTAKQEKVLSPKQSSSSSRPSVLSKKRVFAHGWHWKGKPREKLIALTNDSVPCPRVCYPSVQHLEGDTISERDCVLLRSGPKDTDLPYVAKVAAFWENPDDGEMMMSLLWYYRPEHTDQGRKPGQMEDEVFASRHKDVNSVACIEDKCYVLTYNEYCRYKANLSMDDDMVSLTSVVVPDLPEGYPRKNRLPCEPVSQDIVFFCRHVYDFRQKRILKNPT